MCNTDTACTEKLSRIRLLLSDVDGVLTDGSILYQDNGSEIKAFNVKDGLGIRMLIESGVRVGVVTGRVSKALEHRCRDLGISCIFQGIKNKGLLMDQIAVQTGIHPQHIAFVGDDLNDAAIMKKAGVAVAVGDAHPEIKKLADVITNSCGGRGAVREISEIILTAQGLWDSVMEKFGIRTPKSETDSKC